MDGSDWEEEIWPQSLKKLRCLQFAKDESHIILDFILVLKCRTKKAKLACRTCYFYTSYKIFYGAFGDQKSLNLIALSDSLRFWRTLPK